MTCPREDIGGGYLGNSQLGIFARLRQGLRRKTPIRGESEWGHCSYRRLWAIAIMYILKDSVGVIIDATADSSDTIDSYVVSRANKNTEARKRECTKLHVCTVHVVGHVRIYTIRAVVGGYRHYRFPPLLFMRGKGFFSPEISTFRGGGVLEGGDFLFPRGEGSAANRIPMLPGDRTALRYASSRRTGRIRGGIVVDLNKEWHTSRH